MIIINDMLKTNKSQHDAGNIRYSASTGCTRGCTANMQRIFGLILFLALIFTGLSAFAQDGRPRLGLSVSPMIASPILLQHLRLAEGEGLMVSNIAVGGELDASGLSQGDIILSIDGHSLSKPSDLQEYVASLSNNAQVTLDVIQKGEHRQIYVTLDSLPDKIVWKYTHPISGPHLGQRGGNGALSPFSMPMNQIGKTGSGGSRSSTITSVVMTPQGVKTSTVSISGSLDDPDSEMEITIGQDSYKTRIGDISKLPPEAKEAAESALQRSHGFSFSFGSQGGDIFDEMMKRQAEQMQHFREMFDNLNQMPSQPSHSQQPRDGGVLKPLPPDPNDIRS